MCDNSFFISVYHCINIRESHDMNRHVLPDTKPCINETIHVLFITTFRRVKRTFCCIYAKIKGLIFFNNLFARLV